MIELLEARIAPAAVVTYTDIDGDTVTIKTSAGSNADLSSVIFYSALATQVEVPRINLAAKSDIFDGTSLTVSVKRGPNGDGLAHIGFIDATGLDLGKVKIAGDLGQIHVGSTTNSKPAFASLNVASMGRFGLATQNGMGDLTSEIAGKAGKIMVRTNLWDVTLQSNGFLPAVQISGSVMDSTISSTLGIGSIVVGGSVHNGIFSNANAEKFGKVQVGGSFFGGKIVAGGGLNLVSIRGDLIGQNTAQTGFINVTAGNLGKVRIGGDVFGADKDQTGVIFAAGDIRDILINGSLRGANTDTFFSRSGVIMAGGDLVKAVVKGDVTTDAPTASAGMSGQLRATGRIGSVEIGGDMSVIRATNANAAFSAPAIRAGEDIGRVKIGGDVRGGIVANAIDLKSVLITAFGESAPPPGRDLAIGKITIGGSAGGLLVAAGVEVTGDPLSFSNGPGNADAQIGTVSVRGDWVNSSILAGIDPDGYGVGGAGNAVYPGGLQATISSISKIIIGGSVSGETVQMGVTYGIVAQHIGSVSIAGAKLTLKSLGDAKDVLPLGRSPAKFILREV